MSTTTFSPTPSFVRDRFTWLVYILFGYFVYLVAAIGPIMPFLRSELNLTYTIGGLHLTILAAGSVLSGMYGERLIDRLGRHAVLWGACLVLSLGVLMIVLGGHVAMTLTGALFMGVSGSFVPIITQAALSDHHGEQRNVALTEVQVVVMVCASLTPLFIGTGERIGTGWRSALLLAIGAWVLLAFTSWKVPISESHSAQAFIGTEKNSSSQPLPRAFWFYWTILFLGVSAEWCVSLWGASFFTAVVNFDPALASTLMSLFYVGMIVGRIASRYLVNRLSITRLLLLYEAVAIPSFLCFWLAPFAPLNIVGLVFTGIGIGGFYPLAIAAAMNITVDQSNKASARVSVAAGLAMLIAPFFLGWFADNVGLYASLGLVVILLAIITGVTLANKSTL